MSELDQQASDLMDAVNDLAAAESSVEQSSAELRERMRDRHAQEMKDELEPFLEAQRERLDAIKRDLDTVNGQPLNDGDRSSMAEVERTLDSLERLLDLEDVEGMRPLAKRLDESSGAARRRMMQSRAMLRRGSPDRDAYDDAVSDMRDVEAEASAMLDDIDDVLENARPEPTDAELEEMNQLAEQQRQIGEAADALKQEIEQAADEFPQFEQLSPQMDGAMEFMQDAAESLEQGQMPNALEGERQALRSLRMMKDTLQQTVEKQRQQGPDEQNGGGEKVVIPGEAGPQAFHQAVMDAMKQPGLGTYEDENSLYYKSLVE